jgi:hypothetical protein
MWAAFIVFLVLNIGYARSGSGSVILSHPRSTVPIRLPLQSRQSLDAAEEAGISSVSLTDDKQSVSVYDNQV